MKIHIRTWKCGVAMAGTALLLAVTPAGAQDFVDAPQDQSVELGGNVTFSVEPKFPNLSYQWMRQWPDHVEQLKNETRSSLTLYRVSLADVGYYLCAVMKDGQIQVTPAAALTVEVASSTSTTSGRKSSGSGSITAMDGVGDTLTLFGPPVTSSGGSGTCPGSYVGYVNYTKTSAQGWGWAPTNTLHTASDLNRTDTKVQYAGMYADNGCNQTTVTVPHPTTSPKYRFTIYFPNNVPSTNAYAITLTGFSP